MTGVANTFEEMGLRPLLLANLKKVGYAKPTPIQKHGALVLMNGQDLMGIAQTGSGKTVRFIVGFFDSVRRQDFLTEV